MKHLFYSILILAVAFIGCSDDDDSGHSISSLSVNSGGAGQEITINGENFGTNAADISVRFGPTNAEVILVEDTRILTSVPTEAPIGATTIQVIKDGVTKTINFTVNDPIVGVWVSEGANVAPLLAGPPFNTVRIDAEFNADGTYAVTTTDGNNSQVTLSGTWQTTEGDGLIRNIVVNQSAPTSLVSEGIYRNQNGVLSYEIAQTNPPLTGVTPPTAAAGFGSTSAGALGTINVQTYVRAN